MTQQANEGSITNHPDYTLEKEHLENTIDAIKKELPLLENDGFTINAWDTEVDIRSKRALTLYRCRKADALREVVGTPFFGRVDFSEDGMCLQETFYLGRVGFNGPEPVQVVDWRAPKASVFYESQGGRAKYTVQNEVYYGEVNLKRQFSIKEGVLENFFDSKILASLTNELPGGEKEISDKVLQERLNQWSNSKLKDIIETIRTDQNKIIREPLEQVTLVQGCAGSGKSTIALHRVSYLLYNYKSLEPQKVAIIAPNRLFLDYISGVLPGLELEEINQLTFNELAQDYLAVDLTILKDTQKEISEQEIYHARLVERTTDYPILDAKFKGSLSFRTSIENFVTTKSKESLNTLKDIALFKGNLVITKEEQIKKFNEGNNPYNRRIDSLKKYIRFRIDYFLDTSDLPIEQESSVSSRKGAIRGYIDRLKDSCESQKYLGTMLEGGEEGKHRNKQLRNQLTNELKNIQTEKEQCRIALDSQLIHFELLPTYQELLQSLSGAGEEIDAFIVDHMITNLHAGRIHRDDLSPLCYLKYLLDGITTKYQHIVADEAQDLSPLDFIILKLMSRNSFTILGDLAQAITGYGGIENWDVVLKDVFSGIPTKYSELTQSYRSTAEIVEFANRVIPTGLPRGVPVYRQGTPPKIERTDSFEHTALRAAEMIKFYLEQGCESIAVISKSPGDCEKIYSDIKEVWSEIPGFHLVSENSTTYEGGISVIPIYLAKGLEFDAVIVWDASKKQFAAASLDAKSLFVALSRPLHYLHIFFTEELTPLLSL